MMGREDDPLLGCGAAQGARGGEVGRCADVGREGDPLLGCGAASGEGGALLGRFAGQGVWGGEGGKREVRARRDCCTKFGVELFSGRYA